MQAHWDLGASTMEELLGSPIEIGHFLRLSAGLASALAALHGHGHVHGALQPRLLHLAEDGRRVTLQAPAPGDPAPLAYVSPEQTERLGRPVDTRSDLYAAGVILYEALTGRPPFRARDPLEWVHAHLACRPAPPHAVRPEVPEAVSDILVRLLSKLPEERYQTASGLQHDLERCRRAWKRKGAIAAFPLGERDVPDRLLIPRRLYGRQAETAALLGAYERVARGGSAETVIIQGPAGIGKSALAGVLRGPVGEAGGYFVAGKFDQIRRDMPYRPLLQAVEDLTDHVLAEGEAGEAWWRQRILDVVGARGRLLTDVIPRLEIVTGPQPPLPELPLAEAQQRFQEVFRLFLGVFARPRQPLVLFLDDLQWADAASLQLVASIAARSDVRHLLLVVACRDDEESGALDALQSAAGRLDIGVGPLPARPLEQLLTDTLRAEAAPLADLIHAHSGGNPLLFIRFVMALNEQGRLRFDADALAWQWNLEEIRAQHFARDVVSLVAGRLRQLSPALRAVLQSAACLGNRFSLDTLARVLEQDAAAVASSLDEIERAFLVVRETGCYRFTHDRVQQAAYALVPEAERPAAHLRIGRLLVGDAAQDVLDVAAQVNQGVALLVEPKERRQMAELNLLAGRKARAAAAYGSAAGYLAAGMALVEPDGWSSEHELTCALHLERGQCEWLAGRFEEAEALLQCVLARARRAADRAVACRLMIELFVTRGEGERAVAVGLQGLEALGVTLPTQPSSTESREALERVWSALDGRPIESLASSPTLADETTRLALDLLAALATPAFYTNVHLSMAALCRIAEISLREGNTASSVLGFVGLGMMIGPMYGRYQDGYRFGRLAWDLVERGEFAVHRARVAMIFGNMINFWTRPLQTDLGYLEQGLATALEVGDLTYACYCRNHIVMVLLASGAPLAEVQRDSEDALAFMQAAHYDELYDTVLARHLLVLAMRGLTDEPASFAHDGFDADAFENRQDRERMPITACWYYVHKLQARFLAGDLAGARAALQRAEPLMWTSPSFLTTFDFQYFRALTLAAVHDTAPDAERADVRRQLAEARAHFDVWAQNCPDNFAGKHALVAAEEARVEERWSEAAPLYERAVQRARASGFVHDEGIAAERAARFYRERGMATPSDAYARLARDCWARWRAHALVRRLEAEYAFLSESGGAGPPDLDLLAVVKASQAISGEIVLADLQRTLMRTVLEEAGARRSCLVLVQSGAMTRVAEARADSDEVWFGTVDQVALPLGILRYVQRAREAVLLDDAAQAGPFTDDAYVRREKPRSILCLPVLRQSDLVGLLYLENNLLAGAFPLRLRHVLELLASQASISLENARLYGDVHRLNTDLEYRVRERTRQLEIANRELEAFTYTVSHDLRTPLRAVLGFARLLEKRSTDVLDAEGRDFLGHLLAGAVRMGKQIDALLQLSQAAGGEVSREPLDLSAMARDVAAELQHASPHRGVQWAIADGMTACGDRSLVRSVLENLLGNAHKFTSRRKAARIQVGNRAGVFFVKDNGEGFPSEAAARLFQPFTRLHADADFSGSGIGLATVRRIAERHGGRVWAEGAPGRGATVYFTLEPDEGGAARPTPP